MSRVLLLDADITIFQCSVQSQRSYDWGDECESSVEDFEGATRLFESKVRSAMHVAKCSSVLCALSCRSRRYWRHELGTYKANRTGASPTLRAPLRTWVENYYAHAAKPRLEGDDVLGILATGKYRGRCVIGSADKDLKQIPGLHLNIGKLEQGLKNVLPKEGLRFHMDQTLIGDATDGYPGLPGVGPKRAAAILQDATSWEEGWPLIVAAYEARGKTEDDAVLQARFAHILQSSHWDAKTQEMRLWEPPSLK